MATEGHWVGTTRGRRLRRRFTFMAAVLASATLVADAPEIWATFAGANGKIVLVSNRDGNNEIYVMDANGGNPTRLTHSGSSDSEPAWSPDGTKIAFTSTRDDLNNEIYVMDANGGNETRLTNHPAIDEAPAWSPDGAKIAFMSLQRGSGAYGIFVMDADGANPIRLTANDAHYFEPAWSPDGARIAFVRYDSANEGNYEIYVMDADGANQTRLTDNAAHDSEPAWSPDGAKIAFSKLHLDNKNQIYVMDANGANQIRLTDNDADDAGPAWSPDGSRITFSSDRDGIRQIYVMDPNGANQTNLSQSYVGSDFSPDWQRLPAAAPPPGPGQTSLTLKPSSLSFGTQAVGTQSPAQTVTLTNTGAAPLKASSAGISGTNAGEFVKTGDTCTGASVGPKKKCTIKVAFAPATPGAKSASLTITSNATGSPHQVPLSGTGVVQANMLATTADSPDPVRRGSNLTYTVGAHNLGPSGATTVSMTQSLPNESTFVSATPSQGTCSAGGGTVTCQLGAVASGVIVSVQVVVTVTSPPGSVISGTATVASATADPNGANNSATANTTVCSPLPLLCLGSPA